MERKMYFPKRQLSQEETEKLLRDNKIATLAVNGDGGQPYAVPVHYIYQDGKLYFHSAKYGYKMDAILRDPRVCMTVMGETHLIPEAFTAAFESVVVEGKARLIETMEEREALTKEMIRRWLGTFDEAGQTMVDRTLPRTAVVCVEIQRMTGKAYHG